MAEAVQIPQRGELPDGGLARVKEALQLAWSYLDDEAREKLSVLTDEDTLWALAALVVVWGGFQLTPIAWIADGILAAVAAFQVTTDVWELLAGAADAVGAKTQSEFEASARRIAKGLVGLGIDTLAALLGGSAFGLLRRALRAARGTKATTGIFASAGTDVLLGAGVGIGAMTVAPVASQGWASTRKALNYGVPILGGALFLGGLWAYSRAGRR